VSGSFGLINLNGEPVAAASLEAMQHAMAVWGPDGGDRWCEDAAGLGQLRLYDTPEARSEQLPRWLPDHKLAFTAEARLDTRDELCERFGLTPAQRPQTPDSDLLLRAYLKWGEACPEHLLGDWSFAVWHPAERRLFLARDHYGVTALYYYHDAQRFAFASSRKALYALGAPRRLDELYWAQLLMAWPAYHGERTIDLDLRRLPPAHSLTVTPAGLHVRQYWRLEDTPELHLPTFQDYVDGFLEVYREAVRCRTRSDRPIGVTLSGGLDSGSVAALAARELAEQGKRLAAFTAVPLYDIAPHLQNERTFGDERAYAVATAQFAGTVDVHFLRTEGISPLAGVRQSQWIHDEPQRGAGNAFWIVDLIQQAQAAGTRVLLTGQSGNATVSWTGGLQSLAWRQQLARLGWRRMLRQQVAAWLPATWRTARMHDVRGADLWHERAALRSDFARRIDLESALRRETVHPAAGSTTDPRQQRYRLIKPGRSILGALWAENAAAGGLDVRDPTADVRVMRYCLAVPDRFFCGPTFQDDRWLLRSAMAGWLPEQVRLNRRHGLQAADLLERLRSEAPAVDSLLTALAAGRAADYLDFPRLQNLWQRVQNESSPEARNQTATILLRGIVGGMFLAQMADAP
jgi:asparagine synthase (glutamine-hydrolysing)